jgi:hypothetical protein
MTFYTTNSHEYDMTTNRAPDAIDKTTDYTIVQSTNNILDKNIV